MHCRSFEMLSSWLSDGNGIYPPYSSIGKGSSKSKKKVILGSSISACSLLIAITGVLLYRIYLHRHTKHSELRAKDMHQASPAVLAGGSTGGHDFPHVESPNTKARSRSPSISDVSLEFSYQELAAATDNFSDSNKIGQGGYGSVFYGEIRGQKLAIKMMNMQATKEFLAELKVLTRVHHTNLVRLVGYCTTKALFLVYEYMDNGTLSDHLKHSTHEGGSPLSWTIRVQIALDAARGLEYIHEHTTPTYIHRDIKSSNILLDKHFHAKVADFGLTKLMESGNSSNSLPSRLVGTFGYMAPEYARFGNISAKADVYAFGVVLFQLISAKEAIIYGTEESSAMPWASPTEGLVTLFEKALSDTVLGKEKLQSLVDKAMGDDYPLESVWKMATLAAACTRKEALLRPNMRAVVVALLTLMSSPEDLDTDHIFQNVIHKEVAVVDIHNDALDASIVSLSFHSSRGLSLLPISQITDSNLRFAFEGKVLNLYGTFKSASDYKKYLKADLTDKDSFATITLVASESFIPKFVDKIQLHAFLRVEGANVLKKNSNDGGTVTFSLHVDATTLIVKSEPFNVCLLFVPEITICKYLLKASKDSTLKGTLAFVVIQIDKVAKSRGSGNYEQLTVADGPTSLDLAILSFVHSRRDVYHTIVSQFQKGEIVMYVAKNIGVFKEKPNTLSILDLTLLTPVFGDKRRAELEAVFRTQIFDMGYGKEVYGTLEITNFNNVIIVKKCFLCSGTKVNQLGESCYCFECCKCVDVVEIPTLKDNIVSPTDSSIHVTLVGDSVDKVFQFEDTLVNLYKKNVIATRVRLSKVAKVGTFLLDKQGCVIGFNAAMPSS